MRRACGATRGGASLGDGIRARNGLGVSFVSRLSSRKPFIIFIGQLNGADFGTFAAARTLGKIHKPGCFADAGRKMPWIAVKREQFGVGEKLYV
jgi:hypothetical protein